MLRDYWDCWKGLAVIYDINNFNRLMIIKEAHASCKIDDIMSVSHFDLFVPPKYKKEQMQLIHDYIDAMNFGRKELNRVQLTNKVILSTHEILLTHKNELGGAVRKKQNYIGGVRIGSIGGPPDYDPPEPEEINSCMIDIQKFIKRKDSIDALIKTALLHYQLEVVHPFESANGKIGRILIALSLFHNNIAKQALLPISEFLEVNKVEYFDRIRAVHNFGEYEQWVKFFLKGIGVTADLCLRRIDALIQYREKCFALFKSYERDLKYLPDAFRYAEKQIFFNVDSFATGLNISYNTAARIVDILVELNLLKLLKQQTRNRIYYCSDILDFVGLPIIKDLD